MSRSAGFTILEFTIVAVILGIILVSGIVSYIDAKRNQGVVASAEELADKLRSAHIFAREMRNEKAWGVIAQSNESYALVSGTQVSPIIDRTYRLQPSIKFPTLFSIWFEKGTGEISGDRTILLEVSNVVKKRQVNVIVTETGLVEVQPLVINP